MIALASLRLPPSVEADLRWLYLEAEGELGMQSNFGGFVALMQRGVAGGGDYDQDPITERQAAAARRCRRITEWLCTLGHEHRRILELVVLPHQWPVYVVRSFEHLAGLAVRSEAARDGWRRARGNEAVSAAEEEQAVAAWLNRQCRNAIAPKGADYEPALSSVAAVRREAEADYLSAVHAVRAMRGAR